MKRVVLALLLICGINVQAEEAIKVQATPKVQAVNLAPIETQQPVIKLQPQPETPIKVQATPVVPQSAAPAKSSPETVSAPQTTNTSQVTTPTTQPAVQKTNSQPAYKPPVQTVAPQTNSTGNLTTPSAINIEACARMYSTNAENLFVLALGAIEANGFEIEEIQSHNGYITFKAMGKEFLATVAEIDNKNAIIRINPTNGVYHFAPGIVAKVFEYITFKLTK